MTILQASPNDFIEKAYKELAFETGAGWVDLTKDISNVDLSKISWIEQAISLKAKSIFFVDEFPTVLFFQLDQDLYVDTNELENQIRSLHLQIWNTGSVPLFFIALPTELRVYSAYQKPIRELDEWLSENRWLERVKSVAQIVKLYNFSISEVESGRLFNKMNKEFDRSNRVDQWLLKNLRLLRGKLESGKPKSREYIHALIGRSIFIRYLEDRKILVDEYFLDNNISRGDKYRRYIDVLSSKKDTYNFFHKLRNDFNGDLFPLNEEEENVITEDDLHVLKNFLLGQSIDIQPDLFFWAYKFDIIPIELISTIYEEFYHEHENEEDIGTHYTTTALADFVLSQSLTMDHLKSKAIVLDPSCGSGIFLIEAFKKIVYFESQQRNIDPFGIPREELVDILTNRITGIDVNKSAIQVAAFSLYLAYLDFRNPPDIRAHKALPKLIYDETNKDSGRTLFHSNVFYLTFTEKASCEQSAEKLIDLSEKNKQLNLMQSPLLPIGDKKFDLIVGNPPWGAVKQNDENEIAILWCKTFGYPIGDRELSQCFLWRMQHFLNPKGEIALLVSSGVFFKHQEQSKEFRKSFLKKTKIKAVYNFSHVRNIFFTKQKRNSIAPFAVIFYAPIEDEDSLNQNTLTYVAVKQNFFVDQLQAVVIDKTDIIRAKQTDFLLNDWIWKTLLWGGLADIELIGEMKSYHNELRDVIDDFGMGYQEGGGPKNRSTKEFGVDFELPTNKFRSNLSVSDAIIPIKHRMIHRVRNKNIYKGKRILVKRGISKSVAQIAKIDAKYVDIPFAFRHSIIGFRVDTLSDEQQKILLGILLSSLAKYYYFLTSSTWGFWHDEIHEEEYLSLPIVFPLLEEELTKKIVFSVDQITKPQNIPLLNYEYGLQTNLQENLDEAIFDLYNLSDSQRDLVRDLCKIKLDFYYNGLESVALQPPTIQQLTDYRNAFLDIWADRLSSKGKELEARIYKPIGNILCGISFELKDLGNAKHLEPLENQKDWQNWFNRLSKELPQSLSNKVYIDKIVKALYEDSMLIIKRANQRLWTKSQARQDARELLMEIFKLEWNNIVEEKR